MWMFILKRLGQMVLVFYIFLALLYSLLLAQPGGLENQFVGNPDIPPEAKQELIERLGLDQPPHLQVLSYMWNVTTGDLGVSWSQYPEPVASVLWDALPRTLYLFLLATILAYVVGFVSGKLVAWRRDTMTEKVVLTSSIFLWTVFYPWFALLMLWFFGVQLGWFPLGKFITVEKWLSAPYDADSVFLLMMGSAVAAAVAYLGAWYLIRRNTQDWDTRRTRSRWAAAGIAVVFAAFWAVNPRGEWALDIVWHSVIPVVTLTLVAYASTTLLTRTSMIETVKEDYILTARAKGVPDKTIRDRHASRNALLPVVTSLVLALATVIGGGVITESIFSWPGIGLELLRAITLEDVPLAMGALSFIAVLSLLAHLVADILYAVLDPRIRVQG
ncbi:MAG: ABC transporter permease [Acidimicrobiia bacterium]